jgi:prepilin-type N-terminal cleavage/methylation domain-containing protein
VDGARVTTGASRLADGDGGFTLVELMVSLAVMTLLSTLVGGVLVSAMRATGSLEASAAAVDEGRRISAGLDRELRSATCIRLPAVGAPGNRLVFDTRANGVDQRVTYAVDAGRLTRQIDLGPADTLSERLAPGITAAFTQQATPLRTVQVDVTLQSSKGGTYRLTTTIAGRNAWRACS